MTPCFFCGAPYHPATGGYYTARVVACQRCERAIVAFCKTQNAKFRCTKPRKLSPAVRAQRFLNARV